MFAFGQVRKYNMDCMQFPHLPRLAKSLVSQRLSEFRVVMIEGPRQAGKTTLAREFADDGRVYVSCDEPETQQRIDSDPMGFLAALGGRAIIDEIQRRPMLMSAIKNDVDEHQDFGRYILTGSSTIKALSQLGDSLAGRACLLTLLPFCESEFRGNGDNGFLDYLFGSSNADAFQSQPLENIRATDAIAARGGYAGLIRGPTAKARAAWMSHYCRLIEDRDIPLIRQSKSGARLAHILRLLARGACGLLSVQNIRMEFQIAQATALRLVQTLEDLGIVTLLNNYSPKAEQFAPRSRRKLHFTDSGMLATLRTATPQSALAGKHRSSVMEQLFESFAFSEIQKLCKARDEDHYLYFWSDGSGEVDIVIQHEGSIVGIEVKRKRAPTKKDFRGCERLARLAKHMVRAVVLHAGDAFYNNAELSERYGIPFQAIPAAWLWGRPRTEQLELLAPQ